ncbi:MAG TPA: HEAT repeat domain-containing protein, partial [Gemmatimonadaceae bacterium]
DARRFIALNERVPELREEAIRQIGISDASASRDLMLAALGDPSNLVRAQAIRSLARTDTAAVQAQAVALITTDPSFTVQMAALSVYDPSIAPQGTPLLLDRIARGGSEGVRTAAAMRLLRKPDAAGLDAIESMAAVKESRGVRILALRLLSQWPDRTRGIAVASRYLGDGDPLFASDAARTLAQIGGDAGKATLRRALAGETRVTVKAEITKELAAQK